MNVTVKRPLGLLILLFWSYFFTSLARRAIQNVYSVIPMEFKGTRENTHLGSIITVQTLGYTVTKLIGGILMDRLNPLQVFTYSLISVSGSLLLLSVSSHRIVWSIAYGLTGLTLGSSWPAISKILRISVAPQELATWWGLISSSSNLAGCSGAWISIAVASFSNIFLGDLAWRAPFIFVGVCCTLSALLLIAYQRFVTISIPNEISSKTMPTKDLDPSEPLPTEISKRDQLSLKYLNSGSKHKPYDDDCYSLMSTLKMSQIGSLRSEQECRNEKINQSSNRQGKDPINNRGGYATVQFVKVNIINQISKLFHILSPRQRLLLVSSASVHMCSTFLRYAIGDWIGIMLLSNEYGYSKNTAYSVASSYEFGGIVGSMLIGVVADLKIFSGISLWPSRRIPLIIIQMLIASSALIYFSRIANHNPSLTIIIFISLVLGITVIGTTALCGVLAVELAPPSFSGTAHALSALTANFGSILAGYPFALLAESINWSGAFLVAGIVSGVSVIPLSCF
ncbi:protein transport protein SEC13 [Schistosoma japonicum]|nr:protein transport protein SEC13 [Schistosoma japonicum]KAH8850952.1 protein transport protein SEC13 [Schistosoma japonicum]